MILSEMHITVGTSPIVTISLLTGIAGSNKPQPGPNPLDQCNGKVFHTFVLM